MFERHLSTPSSSTGGNVGGRGRERGVLDLGGRRGALVVDGVVCVKESPWSFGLAGLFVDGDGGQRQDTIRARAG